MVTSYLRSIKGRELGNLKHLDTDIKQINLYAANKKNNKKTC